MARYVLYIKARGRGTREQIMNAPNLATIKSQARRWLEYGSDVTVKSPSGKVTQFTVHTSY
jgi:hypothetical protein